MFTGILLAVSFPTMGLSPLAYVALAPLFIALRRAAPLGGAALGGLSGLVFCLVHFQWFGVFGPAPWLAGSAYEALFFAGFGALAAWGWARRGGGPGPGRPWAAVWLFPALWVAVEWIRAQGPLGITWGDIGYSQYRLLPVIQVASLGGHYAVSFLAALVNAAFALAVEAAWLAQRSGEDPLRLKGKGSAALRQALGSALLCMTLVLAFGMWQCGMSRQAGGRPVSVALVQVNLTQQEKWTPANLWPTLSQLSSMTEQARAQGAQVVIWPETAVPVDLGVTGAVQEYVRALARRTGVWIVAGSPHQEPPVDGRLRMYNSVFLVSPDGAWGERYDKRDLVPFGEYLPWAGLLRRFSVFDRVQDFSPGQNNESFHIMGEGLALLVCFESTQPDLAARAAAAGAGALAMLTNDAWFERTPAAENHAAMAVFRAVENRLPVWQAANTGVSCLVDPYGRVQAWTGIFQPAVVVGRSAWRPGGTVYSRWSARLSWAWVVLAAWGMMGGKGRR